MAGAISEALNAECLLSRSLTHSHTPAIKVKGAVVNGQLVEIDSSNDEWAAGAISEADQYAAEESARHHPCPRSARRQEVMSSTPQRER